MRTVVGVARSVKIVASRILWLRGLRLNRLCWIAVEEVTVSILLNTTKSVDQAVQQRPAQRHEPVPALAPLGFKTP